jgi:hypothetical protein
MLTVICWKWNQEGYRTKFSAEHVNICHEMVKRNLKIPHRFVCITDDPKGVNCETIPLWKSDIHLSEGRPNCYRRLKVFEENAKEWLGDRILSIDLDVVITGDITNIAVRKEDFVIWGDVAKNTHYNGSLFLLKTGTRKEVWNTLTNDAPKITRHIVGSDQAWISHVLGGNESKYTTNDGVYSYKNHLENGRLEPPENARIVIFHGKTDPWNVSHEWVRKHYWG